jgi:hypothetical protein
MHWAEDVPKFVHRDASGKSIEVNIIAGKIGNLAAIPPAPDSWAADPASELAIWTIRLEPRVSWNMPAASAGVNRR